MKRMSPLILLLLIASTLSGQWTQLGPPNGLPTWQEEINGIVAIGDRMVIGSRQSGIFISDDRGDTWRVPADTVPTNQMSGIIESNGRLIAGCPEPGYGVFVSADSGDTWSVVTNGLDGAGFPANNSVLGKVNDMIFLAGYEGLYVSMDDGASWQVTSSGLPFAGTPQGIAGVGTTIFCSWGSGTYASSDGLTWQRTTNGDLPAGNPMVGKLAGSGNNLLMYVFGHGLFISSDMGESWAPISGMDGNDITLRTMYVHNGRIYAAAGIWIYVSDDDGLTWARLDDQGTQPSNVTVMCAGQDHLFAGKLVFSQGALWKRSLTATPITAGPAGLATGFALEPNYPNPFNPATEIRFTIAMATQVTLEVFDIRGGRVAILIEAPLPAGSHAARWDGRDIAGRQVASGVYLYRLRAGSEVAARRMTLLR